MNLRYLANMETLIRQAVPARLKELIAEANLNPNRLAEKRPHDTQHRLRHCSVNGKTTPTLVNLVALASGLGVTVDQLLGTSAVDGLSRNAWWSISARFAWRHSDVTRPSDSSGSGLAFGLGGQFNCSG